MYIIIFEGGTIHSSTILNKNLLKDCENGYCDLLNISDSTCLMYHYGDGTWLPVVNIDTD